MTTTDDSPIINTQEPVVTEGVRFDAEVFNKATDEAEELKRAMQIGRADNDELDPPDVRIA